MVQSKIVLLYVPSVSLAVEFLREAEVPWISSSIISSSVNSSSCGAGAATCTFRLLGSGVF